MYKFGLKNKRLMLRFEMNFRMKLFASLECNKTGLRLVKKL